MRNEFTIISLTEDRRQLVAHGYRTVKSVLAHIQDRIAMSRAPATTRYDSFVVVDADGRIARFGANGTTSEPRFQQLVQAWYRMEKEGEGQ